MNEDIELQRKIAELSDRIKKQKRDATTSGSSPAPAYHSHQSSYTNRYGSYSVRKSGFRNRTLINTGTTPKSASTNVHSGSATPEPGVTTHDRGRVQWTNAAVFDQKSQAKKEAVEQTARARSEAREIKQRSAVLNHVYGSQQAVEAASQAQRPREIIIDDLRFRVTLDGSKLIRVFGACESASTAVGLKSVDGPMASPQSTPRQAKVAGVPFVRTKHGNMIRQSLLKNKRCSPMDTCAETLLSQWHRRIGRGETEIGLCQDFTSTGNKSISSRHSHRRSSSSLDLVPELTMHCTDTTLGSCARGNRCRYKHDINKLAICKEYLRNGSCADGEDCNLSHDLSPHRVPTCTHFLRGSCTKSDCRYAHVSVEPSAKVCKDFARSGYCENGAACTNRHLSECPDYTNTGVCRDRKCRLPHIDRAGTLRKAAALKAADDNEGMSMDVSSDEEDYQDIDSDDADSDEIEEMIITPSGGPGSHELSQQQDYVSL